VSIVPPTEQGVRCVGFASEATCDATTRTPKVQCYDSENMQKSSYVILWFTTLIILTICAWSLYFSLTNFLVPAARGTALQEYLEGPP